MENIKFRFRFLMAAFVILCVLVSCEKIIDISIPDKERKIVVNGLIKSKQPVAVNLSRSLSVLDNDNLIAISGADVRLYYGSDLVGKFQENDPGNYFLQDFIPVDGKSYRLTASVNGLNPVEATAMLPPLVPAISVDTVTLTGEWGQTELRFSVKFRDPGGVHNVYSFGIDVTAKEYDYNTMAYTGKKLTHPGYLSVNTDRFLQDEALNFDGKLYFDDLLFDGALKTVEFGLNEYSFYQSDTVWLDVKMDQIDPTYYLYVRSNNAYQQASGNPFSEPVQVYTNVKGGFGIFAGSSTYSYPLVVKGYGKFR